MSYNLPIRPIGAYTIQFYNSFGDCVLREHWDNTLGGLLAAQEYAINKLPTDPLFHSCSIDRRVYTSLVTTWSPPA